MKKTKSLLALCLLAGCMITGCDTNASSDAASVSVSTVETPSSVSVSETTSSENSDPRYEIYLLAQDAGFEGTYEEWLASIAGKDGDTPYIGDNGNWWIGESDTGVAAKGNDGADGETPYIGDNGNWWIGESDTGVAAKGNDGADGETPYIGDNGNWWIGESDTGVAAEGTDGQDAPHAGETCTVTFELDNGVMPEGYDTVVTVEYGSTLVLPIPTRADASYFEGWFTGTTVNDGQFFNYTPICTDLTLTARWAFTASDIENGAIDIISPIQAVYHAGDILTVQPKELPGKTFSRYTYQYTYDGHTFNSHSTKYEFSLKVGYHSNFSVVYIDTPETASYEGEYIGTYHDGNGEEAQATIYFDGYGLYTLNGERYALNSSDYGNPVSYAPENNGKYIFEDQYLTFYDASFNVETMADGNEYTYISATSDILEAETVIFWLDGVEYVAPESSTCPAAGTYVASVYDSDMEEYVTYTATIGEDGAGTFDQDGYIQSFEVTDTSSYPDSFTICTEFGDEYTIVLQADGTYKGRFGDAKSASYTFEAYVFPFTGIFEGTDSNDTTCKLVLNQDKTGVYYEDDIEMGAVTVVAFDYPNSLTVDYDGDEKTLTLQASGKYKGRIGDSSVLYTFTQMTSCPYAGTFSGTDGDGIECQLVIAKDFSGGYYENGTLQFSFTVTDFNFGGDADYFVITDEYEETYTFTKQADGTFKGRIYASVYYTFTAA